MTNKIDVLKATRNIFKENDIDIINVDNFNKEIHQLFVRQLEKIQNEKDSCPVFLINISASNPIVKRPHDPFVTYEKYESPAAKNTDILISILEIIDHLKQLNTHVFTYAKNDTSPINTAGTILFSSGNKGRRNIDTSTRLSLDHIRSFETNNYKFQNRILIKRLSDNTGLPVDYFYQLFLDHNLREINYTAVGAKLSYLADYVIE